MIYYNARLDLIAYCLSKQSNFMVIEFNERGIVAMINTGEWVKVGKL